MTHINPWELEKEAKWQGKAGYLAWAQAQKTGEDPIEVEKRWSQRHKQQAVAYSDYVRYNEGVSTIQIEPIQTGGISSMPEKSVTIADMKQLLVEEREHTRQLVQEGVDQVRTELTSQFQSFIENNFSPTMDKIDQHFDTIEDHLDRLDVDVAKLRTDMRHVKQTLQTRSRSAPASS